MSDVDDRLNNLLQKIAKEQYFQNYKLQVTPISTGGANYSSILHIAKITSKDKEDLDLFIKVSAIGVKIRENFDINVFNIERFVYTKLNNIYKEIEEKHRIPMKFRKRFAKFYGADMTPPTEIMVLENLAELGFVVYDRMKSIDWQYAATAVTELAKLHSLSMAFIREYPEECKDFSEKYHLEMINDTIVESFWKPGFKTTINVAAEMNKGKLKKFFDQFDRDNIMKLYNPLRCKTITHGDYRPSNLMHRERDDGSLEIIVVDHQTIQIGCPVNDLLYLIFTGTDKEFRANYYDKLIDHYYTQLSEALTRLGMDPETTYPRADFDYELKEKMPFGLAISAVVLPIVTVETEHAPKVSCDMDISNFAVHRTGKVFPDRINGVVEDFIRWGLLKD